MFLLLPRLDSPAATRQLSALSCQFARAQTRAHPSNFPFFLLKRHSSRSFGRRLEELALSSLSSGRASTTNERICNADWRVGLTGLEIRSKPKGHRFRWQAVGNPSPSLSLSFFQPQARLQQLAAAAAPKFTFFDFHSISTPKLRVWPS